MEQSQTIFVLYPDVCQEFCCVAGLPINPLVNPGSMVSGQLLSTCASEHIGASLPIEWIVQEKLQISAAKTVSV